jgi:hypothetical protein
MALRTSSAASIMILVEIEEHARTARIAFARGGARRGPRPRCVWIDFSMRLIDLALGRLGRRTRIDDGHHQDRLLDVRDLVDTQLGQGQQAQAHQRDDDDDHRHRALDAEVGQEHVRAPVF